MRDLLNDRLSSASPPLCLMTTHLENRYIKHDKFSEAVLSAFEKERKQASKKKKKKPLKKKEEKDGVKVFYTETVILFFLRWEVKVFLLKGGS